MYRKTNAIIALFLAVSFASFVNGALAQAITGRISGTVTDGSGALVPGASVKITHDATQQSRGAATDPNGFYVVTNLPVGNYTVTVESRGFKKTTKSGYNLVADGRLTIDITLEAGAVTETVEVVASSGETVNSTGNGFADALLGNFRTYSEASIDPIGFFRFNQIESFVNNSWRVNRKLSLELGVRYAYGSPTYTQANNIVNFDPALYDLSKAVTLNLNGTIGTSTGGIVTTA